MPSYLLAQTWQDLLFAHWPVPAESLRPWIPPGLPIDKYDGEAWIGIVPFLMTGIRLRGTPALPIISRTLELNVRTYVTLNGRPGVFFFSLDATSRLAVRVARTFFHLPYTDAKMSCLDNDGILEYRSERLDRPAPFHARYRPTGPVGYAKSGTLEHFLTERYCFYTSKKSGEILRGDISHQPWPLQAAEAEILENGLTRPWNIELPNINPLLHFSRSLDVRALRVRAVDAGRRL